MRRRDFIALAGGATVAASGVSRLSAADRVYRVALVTTFGTGRTVFSESWFAGMRDLGYVEGKNLIVETRTAAGKPELLPDLVAEIVRSNVDAILAPGSHIGLLVQKATTTIPTVVVASHDGVNIGLYASLARPGANITGIDTSDENFDIKRISYLKEFVPNLSSIALLYNPAFPGARTRFAILTAAAQKFGAQLHAVEFHSVAEKDSAFAHILRLRPDAVVNVADPVVLGERQRIIAFEVEHRIPNMSEFRSFVELAGLVSYGSHLESIWRRAAYYVDRVLQGTKPSDLPVELPTVFDLAVNLKAAKALGLTVPVHFEAIANLVIE